MCCGVISCLTYWPELLKFGPIAVSERNLLRYRVNIELCISCWLSELHQRCLNMLPAGDLITSHGGLPFSDFPVSSLPVSTSRCLLTTSDLVTHWHLSQHFCLHWPRCYDTVGLSSGRTFGLLKTSYYISVRFTYGNRRHVA